MTRIWNAPVQQHGPSPTRDGLPRKREPRHPLWLSGRLLDVESVRRYQLARDAPIYLYKLVAYHVMLRIAAGEMAPNTALPAEQLFAWEYGVSLGTIRHATGLLRDCGLLVTVRSKGTYISKTAPQTAKVILERHENEPVVRQARLTRVLE